MGTVKVTYADTVVRLQSTSHFPHRSTQLEPPADNPENNCSSHWIPTNGQSPRLSHDGFEEEVHTGSLETQTHTYAKDQLVII